VSTDRTGRGFPAGPEAVAALRCGSYRYPLRVFKRGTKDAAGVNNPADPLSAADNGPGGKGKATPKRNAAQAARKTSVVGGGRSRGGGRTGAKGGARLTPDQARLRREAMKRGDDNVLSPRDRGPARRLARDYVDSRRNVMGLFVPIALPVILLGYTNSTILRLIANFGLYTFVAAALLDSIRTSRAVRRLVSVRFPNEKTKGLGLYAALRAMQFRRIRIPGPRVARGAKI
jgi:hypothetical protein